MVIFGRQSISDPALYTNVRTFQSLIVKGIIFVVFSSYSIAKKDPRKSRGVSAVWFMASFLVPS